MAQTTTKEVPIRPDGHSEGCNGFGVIGFDVKEERDPLGEVVLKRIITRYYYCVVPPRAHHVRPTTNEGTPPCL